MIFEWGDGSIKSCSEFWNRDNDEVFAKLSRVQCQTGRHLEASCFVTRQAVEVGGTHVMLVELVPVLLLARSFNLS